MDSRVVRHNFAQRRLLFEVDKLGRLRNVSIAELGRENVLDVFGGDVGDAEFVKAALDVFNLGRVRYTVVTYK